MFLRKKKRPWDAALEYCHRNGKMLAEIHTATQIKAIAEYLHKTHPGGTIFLMSNEYAKILWPLEILILLSSRWVLVSSNKHLGQ